MTGFRSPGVDTALPGAPVPLNSGEEWGTGRGEAGLTYTRVAPLAEQPRGETGAAAARNRALGAQQNAQGLGS